MRAALTRRAERGDLSRGEAGEVVAAYFDCTVALYMFTAPVGWAVGLGVGEFIDPGDAGAPEAGGIDVAELVGTETDGSSDDVALAPGLAVSEGTGAAAIRAVPAP
jgi:hypothetical protein